MKNTGKKLTAVLVAAICAATMPLVACEPKDDSPAEEYGVVLNYNDKTSRPLTVYVEKGGSIKTPDEPLREGYQISGWTTSENGGEEITFPFTPTADTVIYAQWTVEEYSVVLNYNYNNQTEELTKEYGFQLEQPQEPERAGYFIYQWTTDAGVEVNFPYTIKRDIILNAEWRNDSDRITVSFDLNYEDAPAVNDVILIGESLTERRMPTHSRRGYNLLGWATDASATVPEITTADLPYTPSGNVTLYAVWARGEYRVNFNYNYTGAPTSNGIYLRQTILGWDTISEPEAPTRSQGGFNFIFDGWYTSEMEGTKIEFPYTVTQTTNFYAHWISERLTPANNIFDAEFTPISPNTSFPGYSGSGRGPSGGIQNDDGFVHPTSAAYPLLQGEAATSGHYVGMMFAPQLTLTFRIYSQTAASGVTLYANLATELVRDVVITSADGDYSYQFRVNGSNVNYGSISFAGLPDVGRSDQYCNDFREYRIGNISLNEGWNTIELVVNNSTSADGTTEAFAPMVDYIRLETSATLSWQPVFDNLYSFRGRW